MADPQRPPSPDDESKACNDQSVAVAVAPAKKTARPTPRRLPPYRVLLHNDDVNVFEHVVLTILKLTPLPLEDAVARTEEAHTRGVSLLLVTHKERAELYRDQFTSKSLTVTIEPES